MPSEWLLHVYVRLILVYSDYNRIQNDLTVEWIFQISAAMKFPAAVVVLPVLLLSTGTDGQITKTICNIFSPYSHNDAKNETIFHHITILRGFLITYQQYEICAIT
jgi:hypothetical protein